jgi:exodeoxyribonuclease VII small subunit
MPKAKSTKNSSGEVDLSYNEAHTALQLTLAALQANDLDVEEMAGLYRRARGYLDRCEALLTKVEEEVMVWNEGSETPVPLSDSP